MEKTIKEMNDRWPREEARKREKKRWGKARAHGVMEEKGQRGGAEEQSGSEVRVMVVRGTLPPTALKGSHRESSTPRGDVDGVLLFTDTLQTGQGRLFRAVTSSSTPALPTTPIRSPSIRGAPSRPSGLPGLLLLPPLQGYAQGQVLGEMIHCGIPSCLHIPGVGKGTFRVWEASDAEGK